MSSAFTVGLLLGLHALKTIGPLRRLAIREGLAPSYVAPTLMREAPPASR